MKARYHTVMNGINPVTVSIGWYLDRCDKNRRDEFESVVYKYAFWILALYVFHALFASMAITTARACNDPALWLVMATLWLVKRGAQ